MSWNQAPLWKIVNFLSIQGDFEPFQCQWADLSSIDRIKMSYGAIEGDFFFILNFRSWIIYRFSSQLGDFWLNCHIKMPKIRHLGTFLLDKKLGYFRLSTAAADKIYRGFGLRIFGNTDQKYDSKVICTSKISRSTSWFILYSREEINSTRAQCFPSLFYNTEMCNMSNTGGGVLGCQGGAGSSKNSCN